MRRLAPLLFIFLIGCVATPDTPRQRLAAAEVSFNTALKTIDRLADTGVLVKGSDTARAAHTGVLSTNAGLMAWRSNIDDSEAQAAVYAALNSLQALLVELQR